MRFRIVFLISSLILAGLSFSVYCDTFISRDSNEVLHGYVTSQHDNGNTIIYTVQNGLQSVDIGKWKVLKNNFGRNNKVIVIELDGSLYLKHVTNALEAAIKNAVDSGAIFILLEIDSPGGRAVHIEKICDTLLRNNQTQIMAYIKGGQYGGALSGAAAIALACDKIYMSPSSTIGAAAITSTDDPNDKISIAWQQYLESLARRRERPGIIARAMVNRNIEVVEVIENGKHKYIEPMQADANQIVVRTWTKIGSLLTLTATEARQCRISEAIAKSRYEALFFNDATNAEIAVDPSVNEALRTFRKAQLKFSRLRATLDANIKLVEQTDNLEAAINLLREIRQDYKSLLLLAQRFPDLYLDEELIEEQLDSAEDYYKKAKSKKLQIESQNGNRYRKK